MYKNESDKHILKKHLEVLEEWSRSSPSHWGGALVVTSGSFYIFFAKLGPWDNNIESEIRPLLDFETQHPQRISINIANLTSSADIVVHDGNTNALIYGVGALVSNTTGLWEFLIQSAMDHTARNVSVYYAISRLGGKHKYNHSLIFSWDGKPTFSTVPVENGACSLSNDKCRSVALNFLNPPKYQ